MFVDIQTLQAVFPKLYVYIDYLEILVIHSFGLSKPDRGGVCLEQAYVDVASLWITF